MSLQSKNPQEKFVIMNNTEIGFRGSHFDIGGYWGCFVCGPSQSESCNRLVGYVFSSEVESLKDFFSGGITFYLCEHDRKSTEVNIGICSKHFACLHALDQLIFDGHSISAEKIAQAKSVRVVTREKFDTLVAEQARILWGRRELQRRERDWCDSLELFKLVHGHINFSHDDRARYAEFLHHERKAQHAKQDWLESVGKVGKEHVIEG